MPWQADSFQGAIFTKPGEIQPDAQQVWTATTGSLPETVQRPASTPNGLSVASGAHEGFRLVIQSQLGRIDFILSAVPAPTPDPPRIDDIERAGNLLSVLLKSASLSVVPIRTAYVCELAESYDSEDEVLAALESMIGGIRLSKPVQDCIYQINRQKLYDAESKYTMNRISTWSGAYYQMFTASFLSGGVPNAFLPATTRWAACLKVDVNSATSDDIRATFNQMVDENLNEVKAIVRAGISHLLPS